MMLSDLIQTRPVKRVLLTSLKGKTTRTNALTPQEKTATGKLVDGRFEADYASCARLGVRTLIVAFEEFSLVK